MAVIPIQPSWTVGQTVTAAGLNNIPTGINWTFNGRPLCAVHDGGSGSTSLPNQTWVRIVMGTVDIDTHSAYSTANNTYTAPMSGWYMVMGCVVFAPQSTAGVSAATRYVINGTPVAGIGSHPYFNDGTSATGVGLTRTVYMAERDILELQAFQDSGATQVSNNAAASEKPFMDVIYLGAG